MNLFTVIVFGIQLILIKSFPTDIFLVKDYLKLYNISISIFLTCDNTTEKVKNVNTFQKNDIWINFSGVSSESEIRSLNYKNILARLSAPPGVVINLMCNESNTVLKEISSRKMFHYERFWLMFSETMDQAYALLSNQFINVDAEIYLALPANKTDSYQIFEVFNPSFRRGGKLNITQIAYWTLGAGFTFLSPQTKIERRHDLQGLRFPAVIIPTIPKNKTFIEHIESDEYPFFDSGDKNNYRLFQLMKEMFNFNSVIHRAAVWAASSPNGTWKGAVGMLYRDEVDIGISSFRWAIERFGAYEPTTNSYQIQYVFIFLHPKMINTSRVFIAPFNNQVWYLIALVSLVASCAFYQALHTENHEVRDMERARNEITFSNSYLMVFGFFVQQGYSGNPLLTSSRILMTTVLIFSIVAFQFYSSFIISSLLTDPPKTIKTIQQLLDSKVNCFIDEIPFIRDHIEHYQEESVTKLYNKILKHKKPFLPLEEGIDLIKKGGNGFYTDGNHGYHLLKNKLTDQEACDLQEVKYVERVPGGPAVPNKSGLKELIKISLRKMTETGVRSYYWNIWIGHKPKCAKTSIDVVPVDILHFSSALYVPILGIHISVGILMWEIAVNRCKKLCKRISLLATNKKHKGKRSNSITVQ